MHGPRYRFGSFELDPLSRTLSFEGNELRLIGKPFELLLLLVKARGRVVTRQEAVAALWPDTTVHENSLAVAMSTLRQVLGRLGPASEFLETVARQGYRLMLPVHEIRAVPNERGAKEAERGGTLVGREREIAHLCELLGAAASGHGALVWVTGEPGIGKTALLDKVRQDLGQLATRWISASGRCLDMLGAAEDFSPIIQATTEILRGPSRAAMAEALATHCPHWCLYHPAEFAEHAASQQLQRAGTPVDAPVLMRQLTDALVALATQAPLVLFLEDLQWIDRATADFLRLLAARLPRERVLVIGSFRAANGLQAPPLLESLVYRSDGHPEHVLHLGPLAEAEVVALVERHLSSHDHAQELAHVLWKKSEGLPLFAVRLLREALEQGALAGASSNVSGRALEEAFSRTPASVTGFIRQQLLRLAGSERDLLDVAAAMGDEFDTSTLAHALSADEGEIEQRLALLSTSHQLVVRLREHEPGDGRVTVVFRFSHALVQSELYALCPAQRRIELHNRIGAALIGRIRRSQAYSRCDHAYEPRVQTELAFHLERGRNFAGAVLALLRAGDYCDRRFAKREAVVYYERARELLPKTSRQEQALFRVLIAQNMGWARFGLGALDQARSEFRAAGEGVRELELEASNPATQGVLDQGFGYLDVEWEDPLLRRPTAMLPDVATRGVPSLRAEAYFGECAALARAERYTELMEVAGELLALGARTNNDGRRAEGLAWLGEAQLEIGRLEQAIATLDECLALARSLGPGRGLEMSSYARAVVHALQGELARAAGYFDAMRERVAVVHVVALCQVQLGDLHAKQGHVRRALACHREAVELRRGALAERAVPASGWIYRELGAHREALELDLHALACCPGDEPQRQRFLAFSAAATQARLGELSSALALLEKVELPQGMQKNLLNRQPEWQARCEIYGVAERHGELAELAASWLHAAKAEQAREGVLKASAFLAESAIETGDRDGARAHLQTALDSYRTHPIPLFGLRLFRLWERVSRERGERTAAARARDARRTLCESIASTIDDAALRRSFRASAFGSRPASLSSAFGT